MTPKKVKPLQLDIAEASIPKPRTANSRMKRYEF